MEGCGFRDRSAEFAARNAAIVGVSFDGREANAAFAAKFGFTFPLLCDTDRSTGVAYGAAEGPDAPAARRTGVIVGPDGRVRYWFERVKAADFPAEALALV